MKTKLAAIALLAGVSLFPTSGHAALRTYTLKSNAVDKCQAFTPGPSNTIRNRVHGAENIGPAMAVACVFESLEINAAHLSQPHKVFVAFRNNNASGTISVTCTLLTGLAGQSTAYAVTKTAAGIGPGQNVGLLWNPSNNPEPNATTLGDAKVGVNCILPTGADHLHNA